MFEIKTFDSLSVFLVFIRALNFDIDILGLVCAEFTEFSA